MTPQAQESSTNPFVWQLHKDLLDDDYQSDVSHGLFMDSILFTQYDHYEWFICSRQLRVLESLAPSLKRRPRPIEHPRLDLRPDPSVVDRVDLSIVAETSGLLRPSEERRAGWGRGSFRC
jgi:hypothetical protein